MKIAIIIRKLNVAGGAQRIAVSLGKELQSLGHEVTLYAFVLDRSRCFPDLIRDLNVIAIEGGEDKSAQAKGGEDALARKLATLIPDNTDLLNPHDGPAHHVASYVKERSANIRSVWNMNELPAMRWPPELLNFVEDPRFHRIPWRPLILKKAAVFVRMWQDRHFIRKQDSITVFDRYHQSLLERFAGTKSIVIPSGIDHESFPYLLHSAPGKHTQLNLFSSGIFLPYRRFEDIYYALPELVKRGYNPHLTIAGDYTTDPFYHAALGALATRLNISERITLLGRYTDDALRSLLASSHVFVYPHLQSQGVAVYEAMASGLPTIVAPLDGTYETLTDNHDALFVLPKNPSHIADAIERLVTDPKFYLAVSRAGGETVRQFSWRRYALQTLEVFEKVRHREKSMQ